MKRQSLFLTISLIALLAAVTTSWLAQPVSNQELLANFAKAEDFWASIWNIGGLPWWSPMFLQGASLAPAWSFMVTNAVLLAFSLPLGFLAGPKVAAVFCLTVGAVGCFFLARSLVRHPAVPWLAGALFLLNPSVLTRAAGFEHFVVVASLALLPWAFLALHRFATFPAARTAVVAGLAYAALTLAYSKTAVMALPAVSLFFFLALVRSDVRPSPKWFGLAAATFIVLAVIPNLPALRESRFIILFELGPFEAWQNAFATKSPISWVDRGGRITEGVDAGFAPTTANGGTYLGLFAFVVLALALWRGDIHKTADGRVGRLFIWLALLTYWLSFGPRNVLGGQMAFLGLAAGVSDFAPALAWFLFIVQGWILFRLLPMDLPFRGVLGTLLCLVFYLVPGFRLIEWIPIYRDIRAPFDFFQITGALCLILATACLAPGIWHSLKSGPVRSGLGALAVCLALLDVSPYAAGFYRERLPAATFKDFLAVQDYLRDATLPGRVYAFSGRYFFMLTPFLSGRPLVNEAFNSYLQLRGVARLQGTAFLSDDHLKTFFRIAGTSHVLIDKNDPDTPADLQERFRRMLPTAFENESFVIHENRESLGRGFSAQAFLTADDDDLRTASWALGAALLNVATIRSDGLETTGLGRIDDDKVREERTLRQQGKTFQSLPEQPGGNRQQVGFSAMPESAWLVFNEAWHPDWRAFSENRELAVHQAFVGFSAVQAAAGEQVTFRFVPPAWYPLCVGIGLAGWIAALIFVITPGTVAIKKPEAIG